METETKTGEPILVLRANNPAQNLAQMIDADGLIKKVIEEVKNVAERRGIKNVGVVLDGTSMASSNRPFVSEYYKKNYSNNEKIQLKNNEETNFNGYNIFNKDDKHPVVLI